jgi:hypothetical protein
MTDGEKLEGDTVQHASVGNIKYASPFKLAAIMVTINLSTMVASLDLVGIPPGRWIAVTDPCRLGNRGHSYS